MNLDTLYSRYKSGESLKILAKELNLSSGGLRYRFITNGYVLNKTGPYSSQKVNHYYFSKIDSEIKAYLLGFFVADGCIYNHSSAKNSWYFEISLESSDGYILELFRNEIAPTHRLYNRKFKKSRDQIAFRIASKQIANDIMFLGFPQRKTYAELHLPKIKKSLMSHFIRGYFDGDGSVGLYVTSRNYYVRQFTITCNCLTFLEEIQKVLPVKVFINPIKDKTACRLCTNDWKSIKILYDYLYKDATYFLSRKKDKFIVAAITPSELPELKHSQPCND